MSGGLAWASVDPSTNSTIEWITDCGCTITVIRSIGMSNSRCASITSRPLLTRVAELIVMTGPIAQVGCAMACSGVTSASSARVRPRNGPPLAVSTSRRTSSARPPTRHWASAECSESTGTIWPGRGRGRDQRAADDQRLLVGQGQAVPGAQGGEGGFEPDGAGHPVEDDIAGPAGELGGRLGAGEDLGAAARGIARRQRRLQRRGRSGVGDGHDRHVERDRLLGQQGDVPASGGQPDHAEPPRVAHDDVEGLGADRAGAAQEDDVPARGHGAIVADHGATGSHVMSGPVRQLGRHATRHASNLVGRIVERAIDRPVAVAWAHRGVQENRV